MMLFDAHLDLAALAVNGRDLRAPLDRAMPPHPPAAVTLPALRDAGITRCLGTIFTAPGEADQPDGYPVGDAQAAHDVGTRQLDIYHDLARTGDIRLAGARSSTPHHDPSPGGIELGILMENADPIRTPDELPWWAERGVVAIGMAWWASSRYAAGNGVDPADADADFGLSDLGRELVRTIDALGLVHDQSHLADSATRDLFDTTDALVIASHSNCRALVSTGNPRDDQRHLTDDTIREIIRRGGVIGLNLVRNFIARGLDPKTPQRPTIDAALDHVEHICAIAGNTNHVGLGTDMDGGITADDLVGGIDQPNDLAKLGDGLRGRGWNDESVNAFLSENWHRCLAGVLTGASTDELARATPKH
ncbi:MAG: membrane dipeptidase [Planctomycetota bacterium]